MYQQRYAAIASESAKSARAAERRALETAIEKLRSAKAVGALTPASFEATDFLRRLWSALHADLSGPDNALPEDLRASLISIGIWIRREADLIDRGESTNFEGLIDINQIIADGLL